MRVEDIRRLQRLAGLRLDLRLAALRQASAACQETEARLAEIEANLHAALATDWVDPRGAALYETWAGAQQRRLNMALARQRAEQARCRDDAALAFGQSDALQRIDEREAEIRRRERLRRLGAAG